MPRKSPDIQVAHAVAHDASMRPGLLCPGRPSIRRPWATGSGFNEAGAVMPRKPVTAARCWARPPRFNEAGAVMPRKRGVRRHQGTGGGALQ